MTDTEELVSVDLPQVESPKNEKPQVVSKGKRTLLKLHQTSMPDSVRKVTQDEIEARMAELRTHEPRVEIADTAAKVAYVRVKGRGEFTGTIAEIGNPSTFVERNILDSENVIGNGTEIAIVQHVDTEGDVIEVENEMVLLRRDEKKRLYAEPVVDAYTEERLITDVAEGRKSAFLIARDEGDNHNNLILRRDADFRIELLETKKKGPVGVDKFTKVLYESDLDAEGADQVSEVLNPGVPETIHMSYEGSIGTELRMATQEARGGNKESKRLPIQVTRDQIRENGGSMVIRYMVNTAASDVRLEPRMARITEATGETDVQDGDQLRVIEKPFIKAEPLSPDQARRVISEAVKTVDEPEKARVKIFKVYEAGGVARVDSTPADPASLPQMPKK